jgi:hypothetical protein
MDTGKINRDYQTHHNNSAALKASGNNCMKTDSSVNADSSVHDDSKTEDDTSVNEKELTVLFYLQGDLDISESMAEKIVDLERIGSTDDINLVAQFERNIPEEKELEARNYKKEDLIDNAWESTRRYHIIRNDNPDFEEITVERLIALSEKYPDNPSLCQIVAHKYEFMGDEENALKYHNKFNELKRNYLPDADPEEYCPVAKAAIEEEFGNIIYVKHNINGLERAGLKEIKSEVIDEFPIPQCNEHKDNLRDFIEWGMKNYPARNYILSVSGHGNATREVVSMTPSEMREALTEGVENANKQTGRDDSIDAIVFNSCRMGSLEVVTELKDNADIIIGSETIASSKMEHQWDNILSEVQSNIDETGHFDARQFADDYVNYFNVDNFREISDKGFLTVSAVDTDKITELNKSFNKLLETCNDEGVTDNQLFRAAVDAQNFDNGNYRDSLRHLSRHLKDFGDFIRNIQETENIPESVKEAAGDVLEKLEETIISEQHIKGKAERHTSELENVTGLTIWVPENPLHHNTYSRFYEQNVPEFHKDSLWDERLEQAKKNIPEELVEEADYNRLLANYLEQYAPDNFPPEFPEEMIKEINKNPSLKKETEELIERIAFHNYTPDAESEMEKE